MLSLPLTGFLKKNYLKNIKKEKIVRKKNEILEIDRTKKSSPVAMVKNQKSSPGAMVKNKKVVISLFLRASNVVQNNPICLRMMWI
jgi:hypothetical protein